MRTEEGGPRAPCSARHHEGLRGGSAGAPVAQASLDPCSWQLLGGEWGPALILGSLRSACNFPWPVEDTRLTGSPRCQDYTDPRARHPLPVLTRTAGTLPRWWREEERPQGVHRDTGPADPKGPGHGRVQPVPAAPPDGAHVRQLTDRNTADGLGGSGLVLSSLSRSSSSLS